MGTGETVVVMLFCLLHNQFDKCCLHTTHLTISLTTELINPGTPVKGLNSHPMMLRLLSNEASKIKHITIERYNDGDNVIIEFFSSIMKSLDDLSKLLQQILHMQHAHHIMRCC